MAGNNALSSAFYAQLTSLGVPLDGTDPVFLISLMRSAGTWTPTTSAGCSPSGP